MNDKDEYYGYQDMDNKEVVLNYINNMNSVQLVQFLLKCEMAVQVWENYKNSGNINILNNKLEATLKNLFAESKLSEEEERLEQEYKIEGGHYQILQYDEEAIEALLQRVYELEYDEESEEKKAEVVYTIAGLLRMRLAQQKEKGNLWESIQDAIAELLQQMSARDFLTAFEMSGRYGVLEVEAFNDALVEMIPTMTEPEFIRFLVDTQNNVAENVSGNYDNMKLAKMQKLKEGSYELAPLYIRFCESSEEILEIIKKAEEKGMDMLDIMIEASSCCSDERVKAKVIELSKKLSAKQILSYLISTSLDARKNEAIESVILERLDELSEHDIDTLLYVYKISFKENIKQKIKECAIKKGNLYIREDGKYYLKNNLHGGKIRERQELYQSTRSIVARLGTTRCIENFAPRVSKENADSEFLILEEDITDEIVKKYRLDNLDIDTTEGLIEYIVQLQHTNNLNILSIIRKMNQETRIWKDENIGLKTVEDEDIKKMYLKMETMKYLHLYMISRILKIENPKDIIFLSMTYSKGGVFNGAIEESINYFNEDARRKGKKTFNSDSEENSGSDSRYK